MKDKPKTYDISDYCLRTSLFCAGRVLGDNYTSKDCLLMDTMRKDCRLDRWVGHRKSPEYFWSNSGSENPQENTLCKRPTKWLYDHVLKYIGINPYKGLNGDQYRAYFLFLYLRRHEGWVTKSIMQVLFGFIIRLGFFPSLMEHALWKPQAFVCLFACRWYLFPFYLLSLPFLKASIKGMYKRPHLQETTNKITLLPTMKALGISIEYDPKQIAEIYHEYFKVGSDGQFIGEALIYGLRYYKEGL